MAVNCERQARAILKRLGLPFHIEPGKRHHKVFIMGRFTTIVPHGSSSETGRHWKNFEAQLRKVAREANEHP
jgi:hypothetical protein